MPSPHRLALSVAHRLGQLVYLRVAEDSAAGMVTGYLVDADSVLYRVAWADGSESLRYDIELSDSPYHRGE